jgi:hypothetical protein
MLSANTFSDDEFELPNADHDAADATRRRSADGYARFFPRILCAPVQPPHPAVAPSCPSILFLDLQLLHVVRSYRPKTASACTLDIASIECATPPRACVTGGGGDILSCRIARSPTGLKCAPEDRCCRRLLWGYETMTLRRWWPSCAQRITNHNRRRLKFQATPSRLSTIHTAQNNSCPRAPPASSACDFPRIFSQVWNRNAQHSALEAPLAHCRECGESVFPSQVLMRAAPRRGGSRAPLRCER